jgi:hypothetical protein
MVWTMDGLDELNSGICSQSWLRIPSSNTRFVTGEAQTRPLENLRVKGIMYKGSKL